MHVGHIANIAVGRIHAYKAGNHHLLAAELLVIGYIGESLYNYVAAWTLSSSVALVGLYDYNAVLSA